MTWGELHVDFEVALAHLDAHAPNLMLDTDLLRHGPDSLAPDFATWYDVPYIVTHGP